MLSQFVFALIPPVEPFSDLKDAYAMVVAICIRTANQYQASFSPCGQREISVHSEITSRLPRYHFADLRGQRESSVRSELTSRLLRYHFKDLPPQPNAPPD